MLKSKYVAASCALSVMLLAACKSTPEAEPAPVVEEIAQAVEEVQEEVEEAVESVEEELPDIDAINQENQALFEKVEASRLAAIQAGAENANPIAFKAAEAEYEALKLAMASNSGTDLSKALSDLNNRYVGLEIYSSAKSKKERIDQLDFAGYNQRLYDEGTMNLEELATAEGNFTFGSNWLKKAKTADDDFAEVLKSGFKALAKSERTEAFTAKKNADSVKCAVSRKNEYNAAVESFKLGDQNYVTGNPEGAYEKYKSAKESFAGLYESVSAARAKAQAAVDAAKKRVSQSEENAVQADAEKPLGDENVEGIESEETVLLEEDDFTEVNNAQSEGEGSISEDIDEEAEDSAEAAADENVQEAE